jgi:hypothetical protein
MLVPKLNSSCLIRAAEKPVHRLVVDQLPGLLAGVRDVEGRITAVRHPDKITRDIRGAPVLQRRVAAELRLVIEQKHCERRLLLADHRHEIGQRRVDLLELDGPVARRLVGSGREDRDVLGLVFPPLTRIHRRPGRQGEPQQQREQQPVAFPHVPRNTKPALVVKHEPAVADPGSRALTPPRCPAQ